MTFLADCTHFAYIQPVNKPSMVELTEDKKSKFGMLHVLVIAGVNRACMAAI